MASLELSEQIVEYNVEQLRLPLRREIGSLCWGGAAEILEEDGNKYDFVRPIGYADVDTGEIKSFGFDRDLQRHGSFALIVTGNSLNINKWYPDDSLTVSASTNIEEAIIRYNAARPLGHIFDLLARND